MKIRVTVTLDVDPEAWGNEYGVQDSEVRDSVREHVQSDVLSQYASLGLLVEKG